MAKLHAYGVQIPELILFLVFLQHPLCLSLASASYTTQTKYFINCGSSQAVNFPQRTFLGDMNSGSALLFTKRGSTGDVSKNSSSPPALYDTARIFRDPSSYYLFDVNDQGTYIVRLHFMPFPSTNNLSSAVFDVSVPGLTLLSDFQVPNGATSPIVKEFMLYINSTGFELTFAPKVSSFAFINALEVFLVPDGLVADVNSSISPTGKNSSAYYGILSQVLHTVYRIDVGGDQEITAAGDSLWTEWEPDDKYISEPNNAQNKNVASALNHQSDLDTYFAPDLVYQTAKTMASNPSNWQLIPNTTWGFNVSANATHLVRAHLCDIVSVSIFTVYFNLYINGGLAENVNPYNNVPSQNAVPFHFDFVVQSGSTAMINISIGLTNETNDYKAYLNGLEIWEIKGSWDSKSATWQNDLGKKNKVGLTIGLVAGSTILLCIMVFALIMALRHRKPKRTEISAWSPLPVFGGGSSHDKPTDESSHSSLMPQLQLGLKIPLAEIHLATNKFDEKFLVGRGGFGNVYRGTFRNGTKVAVKRSEPGAGQGFSEFQTEITVLSKIRHRHLVSLIGYCAEQSEMILVYEFMEKGSLRDHLYNSSFPPLSWGQRLEICIGAARGLHYLHRGAAGGIIHRDIKSTNILLDENYIAKVADFGLSKSGPLDQSQTHVSTGVKGTFGYLDPEYFKTQQLTEKSDVYSFGVVLFEVLCARPAIDTALPHAQVNLAEWGITCLQKGVFEKILDPSLTGQINPNSLRKFTEIAENCLQEEAELRPAMGDVLWDLEYALQLQQTWVRREMHGDSVTNPSTVMSFSNLERFPSFSMPAIGDDGGPEEKVEAGAPETEMLTSEVFSLLKTKEAR